MECTHHIFILFKIHTGFSTHTAVYLCQKRCRNLNKINTAQIGSCRISVRSPVTPPPRAARYLFSYSDAQSETHTDSLPYPGSWKLLLPESIKIHRHIQAFQAFCTSSPYSPATVSSAAIQIFPQVRFSGFTASASL